MLRISRWYKQSVNQVQGPSGRRAHRKLIPPAHKHLGSGLGTMAWSSVGPALGVLVGAVLLVGREVESNHTPKKEIWEHPQLLISAFAPTFNGK